MLSEFEANMTDIRHVNREFIAEFIELYRAHPALWKVKSKEYANRHLKNVGYDELVEFYKQGDPSADRDLVTRRIQSLRGSFRKELKKVERSVKKNPNAEPYVPNLWYFDLLQFTREQGDSTAGSDNVGHPSSDTEEFDAVMGYNSSEDNNSVEEVSEDENEVERPKANKQEFKRRLTEFPGLKRKNPEPRDERESAKLRTEASRRDEGEISEAFGKFVATKHARLSDEQRMYAETIITQVLNKAILNKLTENSSVTEQRRHTSNT